VQAPPAFDLAPAAAEGVDFVPIAGPRRRGEIARNPIARSHLCFPQPVTELRLLEIRAEADMTQELKRLLERYRLFGNGPELDLARALYRCLRLEERLDKKDPGGGRARPAPA
jgi:hypothetical protein